jgi:hypothetical protein
MCKDFEMVDSKISRVTQDKEQLEKIVLEILGFSDTVDDRFQQVMSKIDEFKMKDKEMVTRVVSD